MTPNTFYVPIIALMQNTGENTMKKEYYSINSLMNIGLNIISKILAK